MFEGFFLYPPGNDHISPPVWCLGPDDFPAFQRWDIFYRFLEGNSALFRYVWVGVILSNEKGPLVV